MRVVPGGISEKQVVDLWRNRLTGGRRMIAECGSQIMVVYPGRPNDDRGADFRDAVIIAGGETFRGDIEIHVRAGAWKGHGHHLDPAYNSVILHVVMRNDAGKSTRLQNGIELPVIALDKCVPPEQWPEAVSTPYINVPCYGVFSRRPETPLLDFIEHAGVERFVKKSSAYLGEIIRAGEGETLYRGIMRALGYSKNTRPFSELSRRLPLKVLEASGGKDVTDEEYFLAVRALLVKTAGLHSDPAAEKLTIPPSFQGLPAEPMSPGDWSFFRVRPANSPVRRLEAMSSLLLRYRAGGLQRGIAGLISEEAENGGGFEEGLRVGGLGGGRTEDIVTNVLLPFAFARKVFRGEPPVNILNLFRRYRVRSVNSLEKHMMGQLGLNGRMVKSAVRRQGLIKIYRDLCIRGRCGDCLLGKFQSGDDIKARTV